MATIITVHVTSSGARVLEPVADALPYRAELDHRYNVKVGHDGRMRVFGPDGELGMDAELAIERGVLRILDPT